jgi:predicted permease
MRRFLRRIHFFLHRRRLEAELAEEMAAHRALLASDVRASFGREIALREDAREVWGWMWIDRLSQDLSWTIRAFRRSPGFTLGAAAVLALGIGANLAELHVFDAILLHRLNIAGADTIYHVYRNAKEFRARAFPHPAAELFRRNCSRCAFVVTEGIVWDGVVLESNTNARLNFVSGNYFSALRILPAWGRLLDENDARPGAPPVAVLGYKYWQDQQGADPHIIGRVLHINGKPVEIVGVAPYDFDGLQPSGIAAWLPVAHRSRLIPGSPPPDSYSVAEEDLYARPQPGASPESLEAELTSLHRELERRAPAQFKPEERILTQRLPGSGILMKHLPPALFLLFALVLLVLLSACANLANMLLAKGVAREREIAIRIGLGAARSRIIRQLLTENLFLAVLGSAAGLLVGYAFARFLVSALGSRSNIHVAMHWEILAGAVALALFSTIASGLAPALRISSAKHKSGRRRAALVGIQVAISTLLLVCSGVLTRNAVRSADIQLAFDYRNMIVVYPTFYREQLPAAVAAQKVTALTARLARLPGVDAVTTSVTPPLSTRISIVNVPSAPPVCVNQVAPNYFVSMRIPIVRGRSFLPGETAAAIVSESAARALWPGDDPVGKSWQFNKALHTVVGVAKDSGANLIVESNSVEAYTPIEPLYVDLSAMIVHVKGNPTPFIRAVPSIGQSMGEPLSVVSMPQAREFTLEGQQKLIMIILSLGMIATLLAASGMFAMVAFSVAQRTREIGIRMAIGAGPRNVLRGVLDQTYAPVLVGMIAGTAAGAALGKVVKSMVWMQLERIVDNPLDISGFALGLAAFLAIAFLATLSPALKALRIDPSSTLRYE